MGRWLFLAAAGLISLLPTPAAAQFYSVFADYDVPVYCGNNVGQSWVSTIAVAHAPDTDNPDLYRELLARSARDALRAQGHAVDSLPNCFFDDPTLPRSSFNRDADALRAQWHEAARILGTVHNVTRLDVASPGDPATRSRATPLPGARQRRLADAPTPATVFPQAREVVGPAAAASLLPPRHDSGAPDDSGAVRALNDAILARHAAIEAEARRRDAQFAEERRRHQQVVDAAAERERLYQQELARTRAAEEQYRRDLAAHQALVAGAQPQPGRQAQSAPSAPPPPQARPQLERPVPPAQAAQPVPPPPASPPPTRQTQQPQLVEWREAVTVCLLDASDAQSRFGNWQCVGPRRVNYAKVGTSAGELDPSALTGLGEGCGTPPEAVRDLGRVGVYRVFGCGFGLNPMARPGSQVDAAVRYGLPDIPGRLSYRCAANETVCSNR